MKLRYDGRLSKFALNLHLRRYLKGSSCAKIKGVDDAAEYRELKAALGRAVQNDPRLTTG